MQTSLAQPLHLVDGVFAELQHGRMVVLTRFLSRGRPRRRGTPTTRRRVRARRRRRRRRRRH